MYAQIWSCLAGIMLCSVGTILPISTSATVMYEDVTGDGKVNSVDTLRLLKYSKGMLASGSIDLKNADVDKNAVIDINDQKILNENLMTGNYSLPYSQSGITFNYDSYTIPVDSEREYIKYDCSMRNTDNYSLSIPTATYSMPVLPMSGSIDDRVLDSSDNAQCIVYLSYKASDGKYYRGTGFIVGDGVIATCAHCLYNGTAFNTNYKIKVYNAEGTSVIATYDAKELHIPKHYFNYPSFNYDYGLIYVDEDLSDYGTMALGLATNEFENTNQTVAVSGFPGTVMGKDTSSRYYGLGEITTAPNDYRLCYTTYTNSGDSGGPAYIEYTLGNEVFRSAIGIHSCSTTDETVHCATRITLPLLRFYYHNSYIG